LEGRSPTPAKLSIRYQGDLTVQGGLQHVFFGAKAHQHGLTILFKQLQTAAASAASRYQQRPRPLLVAPGLFLFANGSIRLPRGVAYGFSL